MPETIKQSEGGAAVRSSDLLADGQILCAGDARVACPLFQAEYGGSKPTSALQLKISKCDVHLACKLNGMWHSRFPRIEWSNVVRNQYSACYVAECANLYYAVAIWSSPVAANRLKNGDTALELRRMAIAPDAPDNTASRMLKIMRLMVAKQMPHITVLLSYQDTEVHKGTIYKASGWKAVACNESTDWTTGTRKRNTAQSLAAKVRWEYTLRESANKPTRKQL